VGDEPVMKNLDDVQRRFIRFLLDHLWEGIFFKGYLVAALCYCNVKMSPLSLNWQD